MRERLYKRGRIWWGWFYCDGQAVYKSTKCRDRKAAEAVVSQWERASADPHYRASHEATLGAALERLLTDRTERGRATGTVSMYKIKALHLRRVLGESRPLARVDARAVDGYVSTRIAEGAARSTIGKELTTLRATLKIAKRRGEFVPDVAAVMPAQWANEYIPRTQYLTGPEVQALLPELLADRGAHVAFILATGARWSESVRAIASDVDLKRGEVRIRGTKTKQAARVVPIVGFAWPLLEHVLRVRSGPGPLFRPWTNVRHDLSTACTRAKVPTVTPNDLRRTCATWLRQLGVEPHLIASMLGHTDSRMVERIYGRMPVGTLGARIRERLGECSRVVVEKGDKRGGSGLGGTENHSDFVPRDGIEPPTRGFSIPISRRVYRQQTMVLRPAV